MEESSIELILLRNNCRIIQQLKHHNGKRYTYEVTSDHERMIAKFHTNSYLLEQRSIHYGIDILEQPSDEMLLSYGIKKQKRSRVITTDQGVLSLLEYVEGQSFESFLNNRKGIDIRIIDKLLQMFESFASIQISTNHYGPALSEAKTIYPSWESFMKDYFSEKIEKCAQRSIISGTEKTRLYKTLCYCGNFLDKTNIVHYDLSASNIIIDPSYEITTIDWDGYYIGDFTYSIAKLLYYLYTNKSIKLFETMREVVTSEFYGKQLNMYLLFVLIEKMPVVFDRKYKERLNQDKELFLNTLKLVTGKFFFTQNQVQLTLTIKSFWITVVRTKLKLSGLESFH